MTSGSFWFAHPHSALTVIVHAIATETPASKIFFIFVSFEIFVFGKVRLFLKFVVIFVLKIVLKFVVNNEPKFVLRKQSKKF